MERLHDRRRELPELGLARHDPDIPVEPALRRGHPVQDLGERGQRRRLVEVGHSHLGEPFAQPRDELGGGQAVTAGVKEVLGVARRGAAEDERPVLGDEPRRALVGRGADSRSRPEHAVGKGPRQGIPVDLAARPRRDRLHDRELGDQWSRQVAAELLDGRLCLELRCDREISDEEGVARRAPPDRCARPRHTGQGEQCRVDLAQLDPTATDLDLLVLAAREDDADPVEAHPVPRAVGARPAQTRHRGIRDLVLGVVEITGQADPADDELTLLTLGHRLTGLVDDCEVPARERKPDPDRRAHR
jgi:hypothetical protein